MLNVARQGQARQLAKVEADAAGITPRVMFGPLFAFVRRRSGQDVVPIRMALVAATNGTRSRRRRS